MIREIVPREKGAIPTPALPIERIGKPTLHVPKTGPHPLGQRGQLSLRGIPVFGSFPLPLSGIRRGPDPILATTPGPEPGTASNPDNPPPIQPTQSRGPEREPVVDIMPLNLGPDPPQRSGHPEIARDPRFDPQYRAAWIDCEPQVEGERAAHYAFNREDDQNRGSRDCAFGPYRDRPRQRERSLETNRYRFSLGEPPTQGPGNLCVIGSKNLGTPILGVSGD